MLDSAEQAARRVHILGIGSIGKQVAHALRGVPNPPPVTLLLHRLSHAEEWQEGRREITLITDGEREARSGFEAEMAIPMPRRHGRTVSVAEAERLDSLTRGQYAEWEKPHEQGTQMSEDDMMAMNKGPPIRNVVVTVKAPSAVPALLAIKHRLNSDSTILFLQNGMGIVEEVNRDVFPDSSNRPHYLLGINSHGVHSSAAFEATHAGFGTISLGTPVRRPSNQPESTSRSTDADTLHDIDIAPSSRYLLQTLTRAPELAAIGTSPTELFKTQLDKLAVNCVINPLTALLDCPNGNLLHNMAMSRCMRLLLAEISSIFIRLPELQGLPNVNTRFSPERLETLCVGVANKTANNISSMLADVRRGKQTEIEYINGYVIRRGEEMGIHAGFNYMVMQLVRGKQQMVQLSGDDDVPFVRDM